MNWIFRCFYLIGLWGCFLGPLALDAADIGWPDQAGPRVISFDFSFLEDAKGEFSLGQARSKWEAGEFQKFDHEVVNFSFTISRFWLHARLDAGLGKQGVLELDEPSLNHVKCYLIGKDGQIDSLESGLAVVPDLKPIPGGRIAFPLEGMAQPREIMLRVDSRIPMLFVLRWFSRSDWVVSEKMNGMLLGVLLTLFTLVILFGIILFLIQKRLIYLSLLAYLVSFGLGFSLIFGMAYEFFYLPHADEWVAVLMGGSQFFILLAYRMLLHEQRPAFAGWRKGFAVASLIFLGIPLLAILSDGTWVISLVMIAIVIVALALVAASFYLHRRGLKGLLLFLLPLSVHLVAIVFGLLSRLNLLTISPSQKSIPLFCLILEMILFLFVIHFQYSKMKQARSEAERLLERSQVQLDLLRARLAGMGLREADSLPLEEDRNRIEQVLADEQLTEILVNPLSDRELEVLNSVAKGFTNRQVAESLFISVNTVKTHLLNIYEKLDASNRTEAARKAGELRLLS